MIGGWDVPVKDSKVRSDRLHKCYHAWRHKACPAVYRNALCWPIRIPVCAADYIGRSCLLCWAEEDLTTVIGNHPNDPGCCTACIFTNLPLCMPDLCMTQNSGESWGVHCANTQYANEGRCSIFYCVLCPCCMGTIVLQERWKDGFH